MNEERKKGGGARVRAVSGDGRRRLCSLSGKKKKKTRRLNEMLVGPGKMVASERGTGRRPQLKS